VRGLAIRFDKHRKMAEEDEAEHIRDHLSAQQDKGEKSEKTEKSSPFNPFGKLAEAVNRTHAERNASAIEKDRDSLRDTLAQIAVIAFIGPSGTGKSTRASAKTRLPLLSMMGC